MNIAFINATLLSLRTTTLLMLFVTIAPAMDWGIRILDNSQKALQVITTAAASTGSFVGTPTVLTPTLAQTTSNGNYGNATSI